MHLYPKLELKLGQNFSKLRKKIKKNYQDQKKNSQNLEKIPKTSGFKKISQEV